MRYIVPKSFTPTSLFNGVMSSLFDDSFGLVPGNDQRSLLSPRVNISETPDAYHIEAELAGVEEKDIDTTFENGVLTIKAEKKAEAEEKDKNFHRIERSYGLFQRSFQLPAEIDEDKISATFKNGVLNVSVPKAEETKKTPKKIEVRKG